jgi:hypothetical protein
MDQAVELFELAAFFPQLSNFRAQRAVFLFQS